MRSGAHDFPAVKLARARHLDRIDDSNRLLVRRLPAIPGTSQAWENWLMISPAWTLIY